MTREQSVLRLLESIQKDVTSAQQKLVAFRAGGSIDDELYSTVEQHISSAHDTVRMVMELAPHVKRSKALLGKIDALVADIHLLRETWICTVLSMRQAVYTVPDVLY
jgi:hypothetical protein